MPITHELPMEELRGRMSGLSASPAGATQLVDNASKILSYWSNDETQCQFTLLAMQRTTQDALP